MIQVGFGHPALGNLGLLARPGNQRKRSCPGWRNVGSAGSRRRLQLAVKVKAVGRSSSGGQTGAAARGNACTLGGYILQLWLSGESDRGIGPVVNPGVARQPAVKKKS
jgi:hypothetical protein